jgi:hypothetical protein
MDVLTLFVLVAALLAGVALFNGVASMAHGGDADAHQSHWLMFKRVGWQGLAVLLLMLALLSQLA